MQKRSGLLIAFIVCSLYVVSSYQKGMKSGDKATVTVVNDMTVEFKDVTQATLEVIMADAVTSNKVVFIDFYTTWCGPCKWMDNNVFNQTEVAKKLNRNFVNYKVDAEDAGGVNTALKYRISAYPTCVFLTPEGEVIHRIEGMIPQEPFMQIVDEVLAANKH